MGTMHESQSGGEGIQVNKKDRDGRKKYCGRHLFVTFSDLTDFGHQDFIYEKTVKRAKYNGFTRPPDIVLQIY